MEKIIIIGAGGFARETLDIIDAINAVKPTYDMLGFVVESKYFKNDCFVNDKPVIGDFNWLKQNSKYCKTVIAVGAPEVRMRLANMALEAGGAFCNLIHPRAIITKWINFGSGVIIAAGAILTNQIKIGNHVQINLDCTVGHDALLDNFVTVAPGSHISGSVSIGEGAYIGTGAVIIEKKNVGKWSIVGASSTVVKDVPDNATVVGAPAGVIKQREEGWQLK